MLHEATRKYITALGDFQLVEYIEQGADAVEPEALEFARSELHRRGAVPEQLEALRASARSNLAMQEEQREEAAQRPLGDRASTWAFVGGMFLLSLCPALPFFIAWGGMNARGEYRKIREMRSAALNGFVSFWVVMLVIVGGFSVIAWLFDLRGWW